MSLSNTLVEPQLSRSFSQLLLLLPKVFWTLLGPRMALLIDIEDEFCIIR